MHNSKEHQVLIDADDQPIKKGDESLAPNPSESNSDNLETDAAADHHSRLLSNEAGELIALDDGNAFLPLELPGVRPPAHPASSGMSAAFRIPHLYASVTSRETTSSATSELEAFFSSQASN